MIRLNFILGLLLGGSLFCSSKACALLPPYYQTTKEITAILNNAQVAEKFGSGRMIGSIVKTDSGYILTARECTLKITLRYKQNPKGFVGPALFDIVLDTFECRK